MVAFVLFSGSPGEGLLVAVFHQVERAADDRLEAPVFGFGDKFERAEHIAVVGQGYALLPVSGGFVHHRSDVRCSVEQGVLGVAVKVYELWHVWE